MTLNLKEWLNSMKPQEGDECKFTLDGKMYRAWVVKRQDEYFLDTPGGARYFPSENVVTKLTLLRPVGHHYVTRVAGDTGFRRDYNIIGTWTKPEEKLMGWEYQHGMTNGPQTTTFVFPPAAKQAIQEIVREEIIDGVRREVNEQLFQKWKAGL